MFPAGPRAHRFFFVTAWGIGKKDAAWKFVRWPASKEKAVHLQGERSIQCSRSSAYNDPRGMANYPADWAKAVSDSLPYGVSYDRPAVTAVSEARDIIGEVVVQSILGQDYRKAAKEAQAKFQALLDREEIGKK
jgi:multiple sugar transport system substrate-binding protein